VPVDSCPVEGVTAQSFTLRSGESAGLKFFEMVPSLQLNSCPIHISDKPRKRGGLEGRNLRQNCTRINGKLPVSPSPAVVVYSMKFCLLKLPVIFVACKFFLDSTLVFKGQESEKKFRKSPTSMRLTLR